MKTNRIIVSDIEQLRDPCVLVADGVYYAYGTGWVCYKNTSGAARDARVHPREGAGGTLVWDVG